MLAGPDLLVVLAIALVVFGPKKLPDWQKRSGKHSQNSRRQPKRSKTAWESVNWGDKKQPDRRGHFNRFSREGIHVRQAASLISPSSLIPTLS